MTTTQKAIKHTLIKIHELEKVKKHDSKLSEDLKRANQELSANEKRLDKDLKDIERLEKLSIKGLFYKVLGSKEEQIEKERQEYLQTALKHKELKKKIELLEYEKSLIDKKIGSISTFKKKLTNLKKKRQDELMWSGSEAGKKLKKILNSQDQLVVHTREFQEALTEGQACTKDLNAVLAYLKKAKNWGNWDMMSKGRTADYYKRDAMDRARDISYHAQRSLDRFERELQDIGRGNLDFDIRLESNKGFMDFFFDNLISDWIVQQKINNSLKKVSLVKKQVSKICKSLSQHIKEMEHDFNGLESEKDSLLLNS